MSISIYTLYGKAFDRVYCFCKKNKINQPHRDRRSVGLNAVVVDTPKAFGTELSQAVTADTATEIDVRAYRDSFMVTTGAILPG